MKVEELIEKHNLKPELAERLRNLNGNEKQLMMVITDLIAVLPVNCKEKQNALICLGLLAEAFPKCKDCECCNGGNKDEDQESLSA